MGAVVRAGQDSGVVSGSVRKKHQKTSRHLHCRHQAFNVEVFVQCTMLVHEAFKKLCELCVGFQVFNWWMEPQSLSWQPELSRQGRG